MNINGKSLITFNELDAKSKIHPEIEIQLYDEFDNFDTNIDELVNIAKQCEQAHITCIHSPLGDKGDLNIENITNNTCYYKLIKTFALAQRMAELYKHDINVVIHTEMSFYNYRFYPKLLDEITSIIKQVLELYPNIILCIENVIPVSYSEKKSLIFCNGTWDDNVNLVKYLREKIETDRIKTVLDTCHAMTTIKILERIFSDQDTTILDEITMEKYFEINKDTIGLIHLADVVDLGMRKGEHGILFKKDRLDEMYKILDLYKKYNYNCDISIEIIEDDYIKNDNFKFMLPYVKKYFK